ncbi:hypothetical protein AYI70_g8978 [Smittium culicis]|uniref:Uncharacterized protein n=1 Tax=Smittium culicis TaxID=133412 RepID=A0A1R1XDF3_9FUNG|nr:hypothetical protein AYI70_g8978 [Smittium culicis]
MTVKSLIDSNIHGSTSKYITTISTVYFKGLVIPDCSTEAEIFEDCTNASSLRKSGYGDAIDNLCSTMTLTTTYEIMPSIITQESLTRNKFKKCNFSNAKNVDNTSPSKTSGSSYASKYTVTITTVYCKGLVIPDCGTEAGIFEDCTNASSLRKSGYGDEIDDLCSTMTLTTTYDIMPSIITEVSSSRNIYTKCNSSKAKSVDSISPTNSLKVSSDSEYITEITSEYSVDLVIQESDEYNDKDENQNTKTLPHKYSESNSINKFYQSAAVTYSHRFNPCSYIVLA